MHFKFISPSIYVNVSYKLIFMFSSCCIDYLVSLTFSIYTSLFIVQYHSFMFRFYVFNFSCRWILLMLSSYFNLYLNMLSIYIWIYALHLCFALSTCIWTNYLYLTVLNVNSYEIIRNWFCLELIFAWCI